MSTTPQTLHDEIVMWQNNAKDQGRTITYTEAKEEIRKAWDRERLIESLDKLTGDERLDVFALYCQSCGTKDPGCQCGNDE